MKPSAPKLVLESLKESRALAISLCGTEVDCQSRWHGLNVLTGKKYNPGRAVAPQPGLC